KQSEQRAFRQKLPHQTALAAAERDARSHFAPPRRGAGEQKVRDVGACNRQQQRDQRSEYEQRTTELPAERPVSAGAILQNNMRRLRRIRYRPRPRPRKHRIEYRLQLRVRYAGCAARNQLYSPVTVVGKIVGLVGVASRPCSLMKIG